MSEQDIIRREEFLDKQDPLRHLRALDADGELVPVQTPSILAQRADLLISGVNHGDTGITVKLALNAAPGCGGIAWPAGEASNRFISSRAVLEILSLAAFDPQVLSSYLLQRGPSFLKSKTVLELGSGTGLVGLVAGYIGAEHVLITDQRYLPNHLFSSLISSSHLHFRALAGLESHFEFKSGFSGYFACDSMLTLLTY